MDATRIEQATFRLPAGTVTFFLSDIEGSTRLWESNPEAMSVAVARHYELLDSAVSLHGGVRPIEQGEGDSIVAAFTRASDALAAARDAQLALHAEPWPEGAELRVRIALHTGEAQLRDEGNYFGQAVIRCARLRAIGHGGQTLLSRAVHDLVADQVSPEVQLVDLGVHRLRDLGRPEQVFGLVHPGLPGEFPPLRSLDALPNNLPGQLTTFIGRRRELEEARAALEGTRVLTLTGAGGCGKTRVGLQLAADVLDLFPGGVWLVELAPLPDPELVAPALAEAIGVRALPGVTPLQAAVDHLAQRRALVVLDNCEHLLAACAEVTEELLSGCAGVTVLATSRAPLGLAAETDWRVPSMAFAAEPQREPIEALRQSDAVRLFLARAAKVRPNFAITADTAPAVAQICHDLDGIPLAIELAAARVRMMSVEQIAEALSDRFHLLTGGARGALPRHRTLRASVDWSHELLGDAERVLLRRLGVFVRGWTLDACEAVCAGDGRERYAILDLLTALVDMSLVQIEEHDGLVRYRFLETVRQYALEGLIEAGEEAAVRDRHRDWFLSLAECVEPNLYAADQDRWLDLLDQDAANLAAALDRAVLTDAEMALRLCVALTVLWKLRGRFVEADSAYGRALDAAGPDPTRLRARVLWARAYVGAYAGGYENPVQHAQEALAIAQELGDDSTAARALDVLGTLTMFPDPVGAGPIQEQAIVLARAAGDDWCLIDATQILGYTYFLQDRHTDAAETLNSVYPLIERMGYREFVSWHWFGLGFGAWVFGDFDRAEELLRRALQAAREVGEPVTEGFSLAQLALIDIDHGRAEEALEALGPGLERIVATGAGMALPSALAVVALAHGALGQLDQARAELEHVLSGATEGFTYMQAWCAWGLARVLLAMGDVEGAEARAVEALEMGRATTSPLAQARANVALATVHAERGMWTDAERTVHDAIRPLIEHGFRPDLPAAFDTLAEIAAGLESHEEAARLLGAAECARQEVGLAPWQHEAERSAALASRMREQLGDASYDEASAAGRALTTDEALAYVRRARGERRRPARGWESLTPTELDVVRHVAAGRTNPQIAGLMFIARGTVKVHLSHIFAKLGIATRSELAAEATRRGLGARLPTKP